MFGYAICSFKKFLKDYSCSMFGTLDFTEQWTNICLRYVYTT